MWKMKMCSCFHRVDFETEVLSFTNPLYCNIESSRSCPHDGCYGHCVRLLCIRCRGIGSVEAGQIRSHILLNQWSIQHVHISYQIIPKYIKVNWTKLLTSNYMMMINKGAISNVPFKRLHVLKYHRLKMFFRYIFLFSLCLCWNRKHVNSF